MICTDTYQSKFGAPRIDDHTSMPLSPAASRAIVPVYFQTFPTSVAPASTQRSQQTMSPLPQPTPPLPRVLYRLKVGDLSENGVKRLLGCIDATSVLDEATSTVLKHLYRMSSDAAASRSKFLAPGTRSVTLVLEDFSGVAYTHGTRLDNDHKQIHLSTSYISKVDSARLGSELRGVIVHEMVHCWQHDGQGTAPSGLIEGVADWVRLKAGLAPPHWKKSSDGNWDAGYDKTAYFLEWLEHTYPNASVAALNERLRENRYVESTFWTALSGKTVDLLWREYAQSLNPS